MKIKHTLSLMFLASVMEATAQQIDPVTVIKNQIDTMHSEERKFDKTFLGMVEKQYVSIKQAEAYLESIGFPYGDDSADSSRFQGVTDSMLAIAHQNREKRLQFLQNALRQAQATARPSPSPIPSPFPPASSLIEKIETEIAADEAQNKEDQYRQAELLELEQLVGLCIDSRYALDEKERANLKTLAKALSAHQSGHGPAMGPSEWQLADDLTRSLSPKRQAIQAADQRIQAKKEAEEAARKAEEANRNAVAAHPTGNTSHPNRTSSAADNFGDRPPRNIDSGTPGAAQTPTAESRPQQADPKPRPDPRPVRDLPSHPQTPP